MTTPIDDRQRGLYRKYELFRVGENDEYREKVTDPFFALRYTTDPHARIALEAYADSCAQDYPELARDLYRALGIDVAETSVEVVNSELRDYLLRNLRGEWVAIRYGMCVAHSPRLSGLREQLRSDNGPKFLIFRVPFESNTEE